MNLVQLYSSYLKYPPIRRLFIVLTIWLLLGVGGCSNHRYYAESEDALDTSDYYHLQDHITTYYPSGVALNFPGYIVGFEETSRDLVTNDRNDVLLDETVFTAGFTVERLLKTLRFNVPFISQVMRYEGRPYGEGNCTLFNLYHNHGTAVVDRCNNDPRNAQIENYDYRSTYTRSWDAIDILKEQLTKDVATKEYTHLIVAVMGLDTAQEEAIRNYKSIISSIRRDAGSSFEPLFVGVTWPSFFANKWFDPLWEALAYPPVADRADVLGLSWLGVLLNEAVMPLSDQIKITVIAHSFGARAATMGLCVGPAILRTDKQGAQRHYSGRVEDFIGIAPAFSLKRFINENYVFYENVYYKDYCPMIGRFIFTASKNDGAFNPVFWSDAVGDHKYMSKYCKQTNHVSVDCTFATSDGRINGYDESVKITYIDTSRLMKYTMPGTKGGGHSDIYRPEIGKLLWTVINELSE